MLMLRGVICLVESMGVGFVGGFLVSCVHLILVFGTESGR